MASVYSSLHESLQQVLSQRLDWSELREVQERSYAAVAAGNDALIIAPTAGGKSEAALIPVMDDILRHGRPGIACLYISPLKALINDQEERFAAFCTPTSLSVRKWHGDVPKGGRSWKGEPPHFLMITPESLEVLLQEREPAADLREVRFIIVDELHAFVETDRGAHLKVLMDRMDRITGRKVIRIGLSATTGNPAEILSWLSDNRHGAELVAVPALPREKRFNFIVEPEEAGRIDAIARIVTGCKALVFVNSRSTAERLAGTLRGRVENLHIHHSSLSAETRKAAEDAFLSRDGACIICTSTLELGIDIGDLDVVVQVGPPDSVSSFLQRMGRGGRRGQPAHMAWVLANACELLCSCAIIECAMDRMVESLRPPEKPYNVLLQQIFLLLHNQGRAGRGTIAKDLLKMPVFSGIGMDDLKNIVSHLVAENYLTTDGEMLMTGTEAERVLGRSNWKDLYSVISGGGEFRAVTPDGEVVGRLDARFVSGHETGEITLGGRTWSMVKCDEGHNLVVVVPSGAGTPRTFWTGSGETGFSSLICEQAARIRERGRTVLPLTEPQQELLAGVLARMPGESGRHILYVREIKRGNAGRIVEVHSPHGIRFNRVLALLIAGYLGKKVRARPTDFLVRVSGAGKEGAGAAVVSAIGAIQAMDPSDIAALLPVPPREGWKFARLLPDDLFSSYSRFGFYHIADFREIARPLAVVVLPPALQSDPGTPPAPPS